MTLAECRQRIDELDYQIHDLLNERAKISLEVAKVKASEGGGPESVMCQAREQQIFEAVKAYNKGPYSEEAITEIFKTIIQSSRELQVEYLSNQ